MPSQNVFVLIAQNVWSEQRDVVGAFLEREQLEDAVLAHRAHPDIRATDVLFAQVWQDGALIESTEVPREDL